jgi:hypothetical protein
MDSGHLAALLPVAGLACEPPARPCPAGTVAHAERARSLGVKQIHASVSGQKLIFRPSTGKIGRPTTARVLA